MVLKLINPCDSPVVATGLGSEKESDSPLLLSCVGVFLEHKKHVSHTLPKNHIPSFSLVPKLLKELLVSMLVLFLSFILERKA